MKKRLYENRSKKKDALFLTLNLIIIYMFMSWDRVFGDIVALAPGLMVTLMYCTTQRRYLMIIFSGFYAVLWALYFPSFLWLSPIFFIIFSMITFTLTKKRKALATIFAMAYIGQFIFCIAFFNNYESFATQFIQLFGYMIVYFHLRFLDKP